MNRQENFIIDTLRKPRTLVIAGAAAGALILHTILPSSTECSYDPNIAAHVVTSGETMSSIAHDVPGVPGRLDWREVASNIAERNHLDGIGGRLVVGQHLDIPTSCD